jgi:hypothetical protein
MTVSQNIKSEVVMVAAKMFTSLGQSRLLEGALENQWGIKAKL